MSEVGRLDLYLLGRCVKKGFRKIVRAVGKVAEAQGQSDGIFRFVEVGTNFDAIKPGCYLFPATSLLAFRRSSRCSRSIL